MKFIISVATIFCALPLFATGNDLIKNPLAYSEKQAELYSEGDMGPSSGSSACTYNNENEQKLILKFDCMGERTVLVFGGEPAKVDFTCNFEFKYVPKMAKYLVVTEDCE